MTDVYGAAYTTIRAGAPGLSNATCEVIAKTIARKLKAPTVAVVASKWAETFIADEQEGPVAGILIDLPDGSQIWSGECSNILLKEAAALEESPDESGQFLMIAMIGQPTRVVAQVATVDDGIALARAAALVAVRDANPEPEWQAEAFAFLYGLIGGAPVTAANVIRLNPEVRARLHRAIYERRPREESYDAMMARLLPNGLPLEVEA